MLVSCKVKDGVPLFEVHKEGLMMLRKFRNKRLRIIFNITHNADHLQKFNEIFLDQANLQQSSTNFSTIHHQSESSNISQLIISQYYKQLSENRVIIFLNAYSNCGNPYLLVIGYLVASVFLYHNHENLSQDSYLTKLLSSLKHLLEATEVSELQKQIKFKSGCSKKPYFMCLFENFNEELFISELNFHDQFREFYKYHEGKHSLNESVDTLIDYFPQRSAIQIGDYTKLQQSKNRVKKLGQGYRSQILGRQIFNFEITGSSLQNLCFEMCEVFNSQTKSINLSKIYTKIINNQKTQVLDNLVQRYSKLTNDLEKQLPYEPGQLLESLTQIQKYIIQESIADSCNCMLFSQYQQIYNSLSKLMKKRFKSITESNKQLLSSRALTCFQQIEQDQQLDHSIRNTNEENATEILEVVQQKILIFIQENLHQFSTRDFLTRLINNLLEKYGEYIGNYMDKNLLAHKDLQQKVSKLELQNRTYQAKCQQLQNQYIYLNSINNQFKQKLLGSNGVPSNQAMSIGLNEAADSLIVNELKKKIIDLQMQINQKNQCIQSLAEVLDKFDLEFNRKYYKPKFSNNIQKLLSEVSHKINEIYTVLSELKKTQNFYEEIHHSMQQKKKQFYEVRDQEKIEQNNLKQKMNQVLKQKKILQQVVQQSREAINNVNNVESEYKGSIDQLQNVCSRLKCSLADTEGELQKYKKALQLVSLYCVNGRIDKLRDFCKVTNDQELKQMLKPIIKK